MKVLILTTSFPRFLGDEASLFVGTLVDALSERGITGDVIVPRDDAELEVDLRGSFTIYRYRYGFFQRGRLAFRQGILPNLRRNWLLALQIPALIAQLMIQGKRRYKHHDILHGQWIITAIPIFFLQKLVKRPYLLTVRGEDIKLLRTPLRYFLRPFLKQAGRITAVSTELAEELRSLLPEMQAKIVAIRNGVTRFSLAENDKQQWREKLQIPNDHKILCYVGRVIPVKQPDLLLTILADVGQAVSTTLLFVGRISEEYQSHLFLRAKSLGIDRSVRFTNALSPRDAGALISLADVYISASSHEGISNSVVEALAAGTPAFLSDIPGHALVVQSGFNGILFDPKNPRAAAKILLELLKNPGLLHQFGENAQKSVEDISWPACARAHEEIYKKVADEWNRTHEAPHNRKELSQTV